MAHTLEQHPGFDSYPEWNQHPEQQPAQSETDIARIAVSKAFELRGEAGVIGTPELSVEARTSAEIRAIDERVRSRRMTEIAESQRTQQRAA